MNRYAKRVDANQSDLIKHIERIPGIQVFDMSAVGQGMGDLLIQQKTLGHTRLLLVEIKDGDKPPSARKLTPRQRERHQLWDIHIVKNVYELWKLLGI